MSISALVDHQIRCNMQNTSFEESNTSRADWCLLCCSHCRTTGFCGLYWELPFWLQLHILQGLCKQWRFLPKYYSTGYTSRAAQLVCTWPYASADGCKTGYEEMAQFARNDALIKARLAFTSRGDVTHVTRTAVNTVHARQYEGHVIIYKAA